MQKAEASEREVKSLVGGAKKTVPARGKNTSISELSKDGEFDELDSIVVGFPRLSTATWMRYFHLTDALF